MLAGQCELSLIASGLTREGAKIVGRHQPDVVLIDLASLDALEPVRAIIAAAPATKVVAIGVTASEQHVVACAEAGVAGYASRDASLEEVIATVASVMRGEAPCSPRVTAILLATVARRNASRHPRPSLTQREREILELIEAGRSNREIERGGTSRGPPARPRALDVRAYRRGCPAQPHRRGARDEPAPRAGCFAPEATEPCREHEVAAFPQIAGLQRVEWELGRVEVARAEVGRFDRAQHIRGSVSEVASVSVAGGAP